MQLRFTGTNGAVVKTRNGQITHVFDPKINLRDLKSYLRNILDFKNFEFKISNIWNHVLVDLTNHGKIFFQSKIFDLLFRRFHSGYSDHNIKKKTRCYLMRS